jgi:hypothetical protein
MKLQMKALLLLALSALAGCNSPSTSLRGLAQDQRDDVLAPVKTAEDAASRRERSVERAAKVRKLLAEKGVGSAADRYYAALVLVQCPTEADLELAQQQALAAADQGEPRGFRVAAEAQDKLLVKRGMMQRYGTQFVWEPVLRAWRLYPIDPRTTDVERKAMGVPGLAELHQQEAALNKKEQNAPQSP